MCTRSATMEKMAAALGGKHAGSSSLGGQTVPHLIVRAHPEKYVVVDIREADEAPQTLLPAAASIPLGALLRKDGKAAGELLAGAADKTLALLCSTGTRALLAAGALTAMGHRAAAVELGLFGCENPLALNPAFAVLLTTKDSPEKAALSLSLLHASLLNNPGKFAVLALMGDGVDLFKVAADGGKCLADESEAGAPFKPLRDLVDSFVAQGGLVVACKSCMKHRNLELKDMRKGIVEGQAPDIQRMIQEAGGVSM
jgi:tRNA 2-thiouridine synthesizing protein D